MAYTVVPVSILLPALQAPDFSSNVLNPNLFTGKFCLDVAPACLISFYVVFRACAHPLMLVLCMPHVLCYVSNSCCHPSNLIVANPFAFVALVILDQCTI